MDIPIGATVEMKDGVTYIVYLSGEKETCTSCDARNTTHCAELTCTCTSRIDENNVHFKIIKQC
jgi:hypothetical protein